MERNPEKLQFFAMSNSNMLSSKEEFDSGQDSENI